MSELVSHESVFGGRLGKDCGASLGRGAHGHVDDWGFSVALVRVGTIT